MRRVIVDTSVWIDFFKNSLTNDYKKRFVELLESESVVITDIIKFEILAGTRNRRDYARTSDLLSPLEELFVKRDEAPLVNEFGWLLKTNGLLGRYTDVTIAFLSRSHDCLIWSFESYFQTLSNKKLVRTLR